MADFFQLVARRTLERDEALAAFGRMRLIAAGLALIALALFGALVAVAVSR